MTSSVSQTKLKNKRVRIMVVIGTRPDAIKIAPVVQRLKESPYFEPILISTGQHIEMVDEVLGLFNLSVDNNLQIMAHRQSLDEIAVRIMAGMSKLIDVYKPEAMVVQGDTSTATFSAIAGFHSKTNIFHVEAGLRSGDIYSPFPEEANRKIISQLANLHLAPTPQSKQNLLTSGIDEKLISVTGNSVIDALLQVTSKNEKPEFDSKLTRFLSDRSEKVILVTAHRRENHGKALQQIAKALAIIADRHKDVKIVFPVHPNPAILSEVQPILGEISNVFLSGPLPYEQFAHLMKLSYFVLTDSGGIQEEAPAFGKPVLVLRENTERPEGVLAGTVKLIGTDTERIVNVVSGLIDNNLEYQEMATAINPYGDGTASVQTVAAFEKYFCVGAHSSYFGTTQ